MSIGIDPGLAILLEKAPSEELDYGFVMDCLKGYNNPRASKSKRLIWFIRKKIPLNLLLFSKLTGQKNVLDQSAFLKMAKDRIDQLDISSAIEDIIHYVRDQEAIQRTWSKEFFHYWVEKIITK